MNTTETASGFEDPYRANEAGVFVPPWPVVHHDDEYDSTGFQALFEMQLNHFWYRGRHRFLLRALKRTLDSCSGDPGERAAIDFGGGCGGWINYLKSRAPGTFRELALGDSSEHALKLAEPLLDRSVRRYQIDLLSLGWQERWDVGFLLDVIEHIPDDAEALRQVSKSLRPGGLLLVTTPALRLFWSYNDELAHHQRRYSRADCQRLAGQAGLELLDARYFMFFLSPLLMLSRLKRPDTARMSHEEIRQHMARTHRVPSWPVNWLLGTVFGLETPLGHLLRFPWGTSILAVYRKPVR